jgi:rubrerythrin
LPAKEVETLSEILIKYLNEQLISEYESMFNYLYHAAVVEDKRIKNLFKDFSVQEFEHAGTLIEIITKYNDEPVFTISHVDREHDLIQLLIRSIATEEAAINKYAMIEQLIEETEYREIMHETIDMEKEHHRLLCEMLEKVKNSYRKENAGKKKQDTGS